MFPNYKVDARDKTQAMNEIKTLEIQIINDMANQW
jgi:hypothetical protein